MNMEITIRQERRCATLTSPFDDEQYGIKANVPIACFVLGLFQDNNEALFVVELLDGRVTYAEPDYIRFVKEAHKC